MCRNENDKDSEGLVNCSFILNRTVFHSDCFVGIFSFHCAACWGYEVSHSIWINVEVVFIVGIMHLCVCMCGRSRGIVKVSWFIRGDFRLHSVVHILISGIHKCISVWHIEWSVWMWQTVSVLQFWWHSGCAMLHIDDLPTVQSKIWDIRLLYNCVKIILIIFKSTAWYLLAIVLLSFLTPQSGNWICVIPHEEGNFFFLVH